MMSPLEALDGHVWSTHLTGWGQVAHTHVNKAIPLVLKRACWLFGVKPSSEPVMAYKFQWYSKKKTLKQYLSREMNLKMLSAKQIPSDKSSHNAPFCNRNVHTYAHFCYKIGHYGILDSDLCNMSVYVKLPLSQWVAESLLSFPSRHMSSAPTPDGPHVPRVTPLPRQRLQTGCLQRQ